MYNNWDEYMSWDLLLHEKSTQLFHSLVDSGSQANLVSQEMLGQLNLSEQNIEKLNEEVIIEGSTGCSSKDAILGQINLPIYILLKRKAKNGDHIFGKTVIKALAHFYEPEGSNFWLPIP